MSLKKIIEKDDLPLMALGLCVGLLGTAIAASASAVFQGGEQYEQVVNGWATIRDVGLYGIFGGAGLGWAASKYIKYKNNKDIEKFK